jgi:hypothetical protein
MHERCHSGLSSAGFNFVIFKFKAFYANRSYFFLSAGFSQPNYVRRRHWLCASTPSNMSQAEMVRGAGFEPAGNTNKDKGNLSSTHRGTHQDSDLVKVNSVWPSLPPAFKAAILAIVNSTEDVR